MVAGTVERIQVVIQAVTRGFVKGMDRAQGRIKTTTANMRGFNFALKENFQTFKKTAPQVQQFGNKGARMGSKFRLATHGLRGFRMELLGVMFFGMMLNRVFMNLLQPIMDVFGLFDLFRIMLIVLFLPLMELLFPPLLALMDWFMNMEDATKIVIGVFVLFGVILGAILFVIGAFGLGLGALTMMFPTLVTAMSAFMAFLIPVGAIILGIIDIFLFWGKNTRKVIRGVATLIVGIIGIILLFLGAPILLVAAIVIALVLIIRFIVKHWDEIVALFRKGWGRLKQGFMNIFNFIKNIFTMIRNFIAGIFLWIIQAALNWGSNLITKFVDGILAVAGKVKDAILGLFPKWARDMIWNTGSFTINILKSVKETLSGGSPVRAVNDFIWRPGQQPISVNPNDTLVGFKGGTPNLGSGSNITNNFYGFTRDELTRELDARDRRMVDEISRLVKQ